MSTARLGTRRLGCLFFLLLLLAATPTSAQVPKNVLVLTSEASQTPGIAMVVDETVSAIRASSGPVNISLESIEPSRLPTDGEALVPLYKQRYGSGRLDLIVTVCAQALDFALRHREDMFRDAPILFSFVDPTMVPALAPGANVSGVFLAPDWVRLIRLSLKLHPNVRRLLVVRGLSDFDRAWQRSLDQVLGGFDSSVATRYLTDGSLRDLLGDVATAPQDSLILYLSVTRDRNGAPFVPRDVLDLVRRVSTVPIYGPASTYLGHGVVGGPVMDIQLHGAELGRMAVRVLAGERPERIKPIMTANMLAFDARELDRFGIRESALPAGASVLFRERGSWTVHLGWVIATLALIVAQTFLIVAMLAQTRNRASLQRSLTARLRFETVLSDISAALGGVPVARMQMAVRATVEVIRRYLEVDRVSIFEFTQDGKAARTVDDAVAGSPPVPATYDPAEMPAITLPLASLQPFVMEKVDDLPKDAVRERAVMREADIRSIAMIPLEVGGSGLGVLSCVSHAKEMKWPPDLVQQLRTLAQVLANLIQRRQTDAAVGESDRLRGDILGSMPAHITVLDRNGVIIAVNDAWMAFGRASGVKAEATISPGASYLRVCERAASEGAPGAAEAFAAIKAICEGRSDSFDSEYPLDTEDDRWFAIKAVPLRRPEGGAVVTHRDITLQKRQDNALRESERRFRLLADALPIGVWMADLDKGCTYFNREWLRFAGRPIEMEVGNGWAERVHSEDAQRVMRTYSGAFDAREPFAMEYRLRRYDGVYRWMLDQGTPRYDANGVFHGFIGGCVDMTERVESERRLRDLSGRLITAQEDERRRIARDLHDDLQQRLALLAMELDGMALARPVLDGEELAARAKGLWRQANEISTEVHRLSYRLHPSKLEALGLLATVQGYCRDLSQHGLRVTFAHDAVPPDVQADVALCVFRILQESLQNVIRHSGVTDAKVALSGGDGALHLVVADNGRGFDVDAAVKRGGLGLVSMRERLHLVGGVMTIRSGPGSGTCVEFKVPCAEEGNGALNKATPQAMRT